MVEMTTGAAGVAADVLVVPVLAGMTWGPGAAEIAAELGEWVESHLERDGFEGKPGQLSSVPGGSSPYGMVMFVGLGSEVDAESLREAAGNVGRSVKKAESVATTLHAVDIEGAAEYVAVGFMLGQYQFDKYRTDPTPVETASLVFVGGTEEDLAAAAVGRAIASGVALARDLVNEPAAGKSPIQMASIAEGLADGGSLTVRVLNEDDIAAERLGGLAAVAQGAHNPARLVEFTYDPDDAKGFVAFVGKGIVFDSGGLSLKTAAGMETMKTDMSGAAAVYGAMQVIAELSLPVKVIGITPITENMPGGGAQRPGDVLTARNGKTIEVLNTDAEGRLVLADGLSLAAEAGPDLIVDIATLTGACRVALGDKIAGLFDNDDDAARRVSNAAEAAGERVWRMPVPDDYRKLIDSDVADMKNTGGRYAGASTAALLLREFVGDIPWVHLDIAGPARSGAAENYVTKGGTGFGARTLVAIAQSFAG